MTTVLIQGQRGFQEPVLPATYVAPKGRNTQNLLVVLPARFPTTTQNLLVVLPARFPTTDSFSILDTEID
jgi:hypothetical protein